MTDRTAVPRTRDHQTTFLGTASTALSQARSVDGAIRFRTIVLIGLSSSPGIAGPGLFGVGAMARMIWIVSTFLFLVGCGSHEAQQSSQSNAASASAVPVTVPPIKVKAGKEARSEA